MSKSNQEQSKNRGDDFPTYSLSSKDRQASDPKPTTLSAAKKELKWARKTGKRYRRDECTGIRAEQTHVVSVSLINGKEYKVSINQKQTAPLLIKEWFYKTTGIPPFQQCLVDRGGKPLSDSANVPQGAKLHIILRLTGGGYKLYGGGRPQVYIPAITLPAIRQKPKELTKEQLSKYTRLKKAALPEGQIRHSMIQDNIKQDLIDAFFGVSRASPKHSSKQKRSPFKKLHWQTLDKEKIPNIRHKMTLDGVENSVVENFCRNNAGVDKTENEESLLSGQKCNVYKIMKKTGTPMPAIHHKAIKEKEEDEKDDQETKLTVKCLDELAKYMRMKKAGLPEGSIRHRMNMETGKKILSILIMY